jgi:hypothetical protein
MSKVIEALKGKKTYIVSALMFIVAGLHAIKATIPVVQSVPDEYFKQAMSFLQELVTAPNGGALLPLLAMALRAGIAKGEVDDE